MVAEAAALRLGTSVAGAAARWWLGARRREQERSLPLEELIRVRVPGLRHQREVRQQFDQIINAVYDRLESALHHAFERLEENGRQAVLNAVCDVFAQADLSDETLLDLNAQPAELVRHLTGSIRPPVGLNEAETRLYTTLLAECAEYYVHIVRSLPPFEERATAELLARTAGLGSAVASILERLPDRSLFAPEGTDQDTAFRRKYLELVSRELDEIELFRRPSGQKAPPRIRSSVAYVSLRATGDDGDRRRRSPRSRPLLKPDMSDWELPGTGASGTGVEEAVSGARRVLLRGEAGSGKTTLLRWLAVTAARGAFTGALTDWNGLTPVLIKLREYSGRPFPAPEAMLDGVAGPITGLMPRGWVERQLDAGTVLLLIDGVDELHDRERRTARDWLRTLLRQYGDGRVIVTSRPAAAAPDWLRQEKFTALHLERMTPPELAAFVRQWHQAVREVGDDLPCPAEEIPRYEQSLLTSLKERAHLQSLAGTPLLAAMLCAMHLNQGRQLPRDRMELYRNALDTLVHNRDAERNVPSAADGKLSLGDKLVLLRDLAWRLSDNNRTEIDLDRAAGHVGAKLRTMRHLDGLDGPAVLEQLRHRSGILRSPAENRMDFVHRTFQEYLAAEEAAQEDRIGNLVGRAHLDQWRETIIMTAGHANTPQREELLGGILDRAEREPRHARALRLLAASCQETLPSVPDGLGHRLDDAVTRLLPARRKTDPPALAAVGPSLLRWLPRSLEELTESTAAQTVRTAALIGGEQALDLLTTYAEDSRGDVIRALIEAWDQFDAKAYADHVLSRLPLAEHLVDIKHSGQLAAARKLSSLQWLQVSHPVRDLEFLGDLPPLTHLSVTDQRGNADLSLLRCHPGLQSFDITGTGPLTNTSVLTDLDKLTTLWIAAHDLELSALRHIPRLEDLLLDQLAPSQNLSPLTQLAGLTDLQLFGDDEHKLSGLERLDGLAALRRLMLMDCDVHAWLASLESPPPSLRIMNLRRCVVPADPRAFAGFSKLDFLHLSTCRTPDGAPITALDLPGVHVSIR